MVFHGKYTFRSTNATGATKLATSSSSEGKTYPTVSADEATELERWIVYQDEESGGLLVQMGDLFYLSAVEEVGWVVGDPSRAAAYPFRLDDRGGGQVALEIFVAARDAWLPVRYSVNVQLPYLVFPIPGGELAAGGETLYAFARQTVTPPLAVIQSSKDARGLDLRKVDLTGADLSGVDCTGADFTGATLDGASFAGAVLCGATFLGGSLHRTVLAGATLDGAVFSGTNLSTVEWGEAISAKGAHLDGCVGIGCIIGSQEPGKVADLSGADLTGADFSRADFTHASLSEATLLRGVFVGAVFEQTDFTSAQLGGVEKSAAADMAFTYMPNVRFDKANLFGVSFAFATVFGASTRMADTATMEQADFSNAYLEGIDLTGATLRGVKLNNACLVNVDLSQADLSPTLSGSVTSSLGGACLQGAVFTQAKLGNADLTGATVAFSNGTIRVRYCDPRIGGPFPPPPDFEPLNYSPTESLDLTTMTAGTVCPNGLTVAANQRQGNTLTEMLTIHDPATEWVPLRCSFSDPAEPGPGDPIDSGAGDSMAPLDRRPEVPVDPEEPGEGSPAGRRAVPGRSPRVALETPNVELRVFSLRDFRALRRLADDPDARRFLFWNQHLSDQRLKAMIHHYRIRQERTGVTSWPAYRKADGAFIGVCGLADHPQIGGVEINVGVVPELRGDPVVREMYRGVLDHGFSELGLGRILGLVEAENEAARRFVDKIGFRFLREMLVQGMVPYRLYEITLEDMERAAEAG